ncbi:DUF1877 family protein [Streptomyces sp. NPDC001933]|uniref:DUF1877 family protein n=1 Tax=Streptomyces sp. NPDC001933 TaxID=3364626 RepID=UPI0036BA65D3
MSTVLMYARFAPEQLARYASDWYAVVEWYGEWDESDVPIVSVPQKSIALFEFVLADAGTPVTLYTLGIHEGTIRQPDDVEPWLLSDVGEFFEPWSVTPAGVTALAAALGGNPFDSLVARADSAKMAAAGVALVPDRGRRKGFDKSHYEELAGFLADAAAAGEGLIVFYVD